MIKGQLHGAASHAHAHALDGERAKKFIDFVRQCSPDSDPVTVMLFGQMMHANSLLLNIMEKNLGAPGLTYAKFRLLMSLARGEQYGAAEGMQPSELSEQQNISRNTVSALIANLEKDGMVSRALHGTDRRRFVIKLTPEGRKVVRAHLSDQFKCVTQCFSSLSRQEREQLFQLLGRLNKDLLKQSKQPCRKGADNS